MEIVIPQREKELVFSEREKMFAIEFSLAYKLADRQIPDQATIRAKALDASKNLRIEDKLIHRLFEIARADFSPVPSLRDLTNSIPRLNGEKLSVINRKNRNRLMAPNNERTLNDKEYEAWNRWVKKEIDRLQNGESPTEVPFRWELRDGEIFNLDAIDNDFEELPEYLR